MAAFRLSRHHLSRRAPASALTSVASDMCGAQAQVLSAAQMSLGARLRGAEVRHLESALWKERTLVRAWGMRRTMFLLPSEKLAVFARGTTRRPAYNYQWAMERVSSKQALDRLLDDVHEILAEPRTRTELAQSLEAMGHRMKWKAGGGWGDSSAVPWVSVGGTHLSVGFLLHTIAARDVICSGPGVGNESTHVRADRWLPGWRDVPVEEAEGALLEMYLAAFGPATVADFAVWIGVYVRDAKEIWERASSRLAPVEVDGKKAAVLASDVGELKNSEIEPHVVRLLPFFDSFLLGHKSHLDMVDEPDLKRVYRNQGWVSPVVLVDGRARGTWSHRRRGDGLDVTVTLFSSLPGGIRRLVEEEAADLGRFFGCAGVRTTGA